MDFPEYAHTGRTSCPGEGKMDSVEKAAIDEILRELPGQIEAKAGELREARKAYRMAKAEHENMMAKVTLTIKLKDPDATQTDVKAEAIVASIDLKYKMIAEQSKYEAKQAEYQRLRDDLTTIEQRANNYRLEIKALKG
jgi:predicted  nucleic acid-binding Zn-ribbon protein